MSIHAGHGGGHFLKASLTCDLCPLLNCDLSDWHLHVHVDRSNHCVCISPPAPRLCKKKTPPLAINLINDEVMNTFDVLVQLPQQNALPKSCKQVLVCMTGGVPL